MTPVEKLLWRYLQLTDGCQLTRFVTEKGYLWVSTNSNYRLEIFNQTDDYPANGVIMQGDMIIADAIN